MRKCSSRTAGSFTQDHPLEYMAATGSHGSALNRIIPVLGYATIAATRRVTASIWARASA